VPPIRGGREAGRDGKEGEASVPNTRKALEVKRTYFPQPRGVALNTTAMREALPLDPPTAVLLTAGRSSPSAGPGHPAAEIIHAMAFPSRMAYPRGRSLVRLPLGGSHHVPQREATGRGWRSVMPGHVLWPAILPSLTPVSRTFSTGTTGSGGVHIWSPECSPGLTQSKGRHAPPGLAGRRQVTALKWLATERAGIIWPWHADCDLPFPGRPWSG
jgi:hypothetical protein